MDLSPKLATSITKSVFNTLREAYKNRQEKRLVEFLECIDLRYDLMSIEDQVKLNEYIESDIGQDLLASYATTITQTSSRGVRMAMALLYCQDSEFDFDDSEKSLFATAMNGITDDIISFFIHTTKLEAQIENLPYPRAGIHNNNFHEFSEVGWDEESIFVYVNDLMGRWLLLPDPASYSGGGMGGGDGWAIWFGVTEKSKKIAHLLIKAEALLT